MKCQLTGTNDNNLETPQYPEARFTHKELSSTFEGWITGCSRFEPIMIFSKNIVCVDKGHVLSRVQWITPGPNKMGHFLLSPDQIQHLLNSDPQYQPGVQLGWFESKDKTQWQSWVVHYWFQFHSGFLTQMTWLQWHLLIWETCFHGDDQRCHRGAACHWLQLTWKRMRNETLLLLHKWQEVPPLCWYISFHDMFQTINGMWSHIHGHHELIPPIFVIQLVLD